MNAAHSMNRGLAWILCACFLLLGYSPIPVIAQILNGPKPPCPPGYKLIEGDILVPGDGPTPQAVWSTDFWSGGEVPYEFDENVSTANRQHARNAMAIWEAAANIHFVPRDGTLYYIHIQDSTGNSSPVGRQLFSHDVSIVNWTNEFIIAHELGHTLGFWHEHSRSDRDSYIVINWLNIINYGLPWPFPNEAHNFEKHDEADHYGPYDFDSLMHYSACAWSKCGPVQECSDCDSECRTITVLPPYAEWQCKIGQREYLSDWDKLVMSFLYSYSNWRFVDVRYAMPDWAQKGTFLQPYQSLRKGTDEVPSGGTVWIQPGAYSAVGTWTKAMTLKAPLGGVTLQ